MCGEKSWLFSSTSNWAGSPPRMRGKDAGCLVHHEKHRITPACAGKRSIPGHPVLCSRDHPRVCGEKCLRTARKRSILGSPPHVRGKVALYPGYGSTPGITPACAGKRGRPHSGPGTTRDHPRVCGEKPTQTAPTPVSPISSMARWVTRVPGPSSSTEMPAAGI